MFIAHISPKYAMLRPLLAKLKESEMTCLDPSGGGNMRHAWHIFSDVHVPPQHDKVLLDMNNAI